MRKAPTRQIAQEVLRVVDCGLVKGVGVAQEGQMCVEAAVCYAMGEPHGDNPSGVGVAVRAFKIRLNDSSRWSSDAARAKGLREIAIVQLGSDKLDQREFTSRLAVKTVKHLLSRVLRRCGLEELAKECEEVETREEAREVALKARKVTYVTAAYAATAAAADAAYAAAAYAAAAAADAAADADAAAYAAAAYAAAAYAADADKILTFSARLATQVLVDMGCEGAQWLDLVQE